MAAVLFCEYAIAGDEALHQYEAWANADPNRWVGAERLASMEQPGLFVEMWRFAEDAEALRNKQERREGRSGWSEMEQWVKGGRDGLRIWLFRSADYRPVAVPKGRV